MLTKNLRIFTECRYSGWWWRKSRENKVYRNESCQNAG